MTRNQSGAMPDVTLFSKCLGINDSEVETGAKVNLETGETELKRGFNVTVTDEGKLVSVPGLQEFVQFSTGNVTVVSAGSAMANSGRLLVQIGTGLYEYVSGTWMPIQRVVASVLSPVALTGTVKIIHTNLDIRYNDNGVNYRVPNNSTTAVACSVGTYNGPATSRRYYAMPVFDGGFVVNGILYVWKGQFVQYSLPYYYDLFQLGDCHIGLEESIINGEGTADAIVLLTANSVVVLPGKNPSNYSFVKYPGIKPLANTLTSFWSPHLESYVTMFLAEDGVYVVGPDLKLVNVTVGQYDRTLGSEGCSFTGASVVGSKYIAYGTPYCVEYDIKNKAVLHRDVLTERVINSSCVWLGKRLIGCDTGVWMDTGSNARQLSNINIKLPATDFELRVKKRIRAFYISGEFSGELTFTLHADDSNSPAFSKTVSGKTDRMKVVNFWKKKFDFCSVEISFEGDYFRLDELKAVYDTTLGGNGE